MELRDWKTAEAAAEEMISELQTPKAMALAHYRFGMVLLNDGIDKHKEEVFNRCHEEMTTALGAAPNFPGALFADGQALAISTRTMLRKRALRSTSKWLAPSFKVTTVDGRRISLDDLTGKVVLIDFWATWCGPCRAALPHVREIARKFEGQPLVVLSVSVDTNEEKWKDFIAKNEMTWPQYFDGGFTGPLAKWFGLQAIPYTFMIDADGVLQDEHIGDASIEGKLKKLVRRAEETQAAQSR
jgi:thiol-disulfide isomerase/thioredoxin